MRVVRGRLADPVADGERTGALLAAVRETGEPTLRVWQPPRQLSFGPRDVQAPGYRDAREQAASRGFPPTERRTGGRAVAYTGTTVGFALAAPVANLRSGVGERYDEAVLAVQRALWRLGVPAQRGEPAESFCPGNHGLAWQGKLAGVAQRVTRDAGLVGGLVVVDDHDVVAEVLGPVYDALDLPFDPDTVGSVVRAGGRADPDAVIETIEAMLVGDREVQIGRVET